MNAALRRQPARRHTELLQRVRERHRQVRVVLRVVVRGAVEAVCHTERETTSNGNADPTLHAAAVGRAGLNRRSRQYDEVGHLPPLKRKFHDPLVLDDVTDAGAAHVDDGRRGLY